MFDISITVATLRIWFTIGYCCSRHAFQNWIHNTHNVDINMVLYSKIPWQWALGMGHWYDSCSSTTCQGPSVSQISFQSRLVASTSTGLGRGAQLSWSWSQWGLLRQVHRCDYSYSWFAKLWFRSFLKFPNGAWSSTTSSSKSWTGKETGSEACPGTVVDQRPPDLPKWKNMIFNMRCGCKCRCFEPFKQVSEFDRLAKLRKTIPQLDKTEQDNHAAPSKIHPHHPFNAL